jgi:hypothetical protein
MRGLFDLLNSDLHNKLKRSFCIISAKKSWKNGLIMISIMVAAITTMNKEENLFKVSK